MSSLDSTTIDPKLMQLVTEGNYPCPSWQELQPAQQVEVLRAYLGKFKDDLNLLPAETPDEIARLADNSIVPIVELHGHGIGRKEKCINLSLTPTSGLPNLGWDGQSFDSNRLYWSRNNKLVMVFYINRSRTAHYERHFVLQDDSALQALFTEYPLMGLIIMERCEEVVQEAIRSRQRMLASMEARRESAKQMRERLTEGCDWRFLEAPRERGGPHWVVPDSTWP